MFTSKKYDLERLRADLRFAASTIAALKKHMRRSHYTPTLQEHRDLSMWKDAATNLCCLRAHHRGKIHLPDYAKNLVAVTRLEAKYMLKQETVAA
jgi:hypothetical protein